MNHLFKILGLQQKWGRLTIAEDKVINCPPNFQDENLFSPSILFYVDNPEHSK